MEILHDVRPSQYPWIKPIGLGTDLMPNKAHVGDAGFDVFSHTEVVIYPSNFKIIDLGFAIQIPLGWVALIQGRSGLAADKGLFTIGNVIDSNYRGECHAILCNFGSVPVEIRYGMKIAQMLIMPCYTHNRTVITDELTPSNRESNGFGSTGG